MDSAFYYVRRLFMQRIFILISILILFSCAGQLRQVPLKMADISDRLAPLDNRPDMNFVAKAGIYYPRVDVNRFDEFFKKTAEIRGTIVVARGMLEHEKVLISNLGKELSLSNTQEIKKLVEELKVKKRGIVKDKLSPIREWLDNMILIKDLVMSLEGRTKDLINEAQELINISPEQFKSDPQKAFLAVKALNESLNNLKKAANEIPEFAKTFEDFIEMVKPLVD